MAGGATGILGALRIVVDADTDKAQRALDAMGGRAQVFGAAVGAAAGGAAIAALRMGDTYDAVLDGIRSKTGATGDTLASLEGQVQAVAGHVTEDLTVVGDVMTSVYQKTGLVGDAAGRTTESLIDLARLTGGDYVKTADAVTASYKNWNIAAEDQVAANDMLLRAYQQSGVAVDVLGDSLTKNGTILRELGFSYADSTVLLTALGKAGIDANAVMGPLRKSLATMAKEGKDPAEALQTIFDSIKNAPSDTKAANIALKTFGAKGVQMAALIRDGTLDVNALWDAVAAGGDTVQAASDDTRDWADGVKELMNQVTVAVGPVTSMFAGLSDAMGNAIYLLPALGGFVGKWAGKLASAGAGAVQSGITAMLAKVGLDGAATALAGKFASLFAAALPIVGVAALGVAIGVAIGKAIVGPEVEKSMKDEAGKATAALAGATTIEELDRQRAVLEKGLADAEALPFSNFLFGSSDQLRAQIADIDAKKAELEAAAQGTVEAVQDAADGSSLTASKMTLAERLQDELTKAAAVAGKGRDAIVAGLGTTAGEVEGMLAGKMDFAAPLIAELKGAKPRFRAAILDSLNLSGDVRAYLESQIGTKVGGGIRSGFKIASKAAIAGFGSVADALKNPPKLRTKAWRMGHLEKQMKGVMANLRKAVKVGDPFAIRYWETARAKVQGQQDRLRKRTVATMSDVKKTYRAAGVDVEGTWADIKNTTDKKSQAASSKAIGEAQQTKAGIDAVDLTGSGRSLMTELASGIYSGIPAVRAAATAAADAAAVPLEAHSPPKSGPLANIDRWGGVLMDTWARGIEGSTGRVAAAGARVAGAFHPNPTLGANLAGAGAGAGGGGTHYHIGTVVSTDRSMDALDRRMKRRQRMRKRDRGRGYGTAPADTR